MEMDNESTDAEALEYSFNDLPNEVLEFILSFLLPYKDLQDSMCVCKRWNACAKSVMRKAENNLYRAIKDVKINWKTFTPPDSIPTISKRFSHAACVHENSMYIFGGCTTNSTAFNDLWRFDLSKRQWIRPLAMGTYPSPKAYATMVPYKDNLILFGGWTSPVPSSIYGCWTMFNEVHAYNITSNRWIPLNATKSPPPIAGHSAAIRDDTMIIYGGMYKPPILQSQSQSSSDVWTLDLKTLVWINQPTTDPVPPPRYGQSLIVLDKDNIMILGGIKSKVYTDCWILNMTGSVWTWTEVTVKNKQWAAPHIWCNPACKVGDKVVTLGYEQNGPMYPLLSAARMNRQERAEENSVTHRLEQNMRRLVDKDNNVNGRRGVLPHQRPNNNNVNKPNPAGNSSTSNDESKAGPSGVPSHSNSSLGKLIKTNDIVNKSTQTKDIVNKSTQTIDVSELYQKENEPNDIANRNVQQIKTINLRNRGIPGRKLLPNGFRMTRHVRDSNNIRMAAFAADPSINNIPPVNPAFNQQRVIARRPEVREVVNVPDAVPAVKKIRCNTLTMQVLDISSVLTDGSRPTVSWMQPQVGEIDGAPEEVIMYSLVRGKGELIMFGGLHCNADLNCPFSFQLPRNFSNSLHFIIPPRNII